MTVVYRQVLNFAVASRGFRLAANGTYAVLFYQHALIVLRTKAKLFGDPIPMLPLGIISREA
jgi:hypothetical protein